MSYPHDPGQPADVPASEPSPYAPPPENSYVPPPYTPPSPYAAPTPADNPYMPPYAQTDAAPQYDQPLFTTPAYDPSTAYGAQPQYQQPYPTQGFPAAPYGYGQPMMPMQPPRRSRTGLIIAIIVVAVVVLCGGGIAAAVLIGHSTDSAKSPSPGVTVKAPVQGGAQPTGTDPTPIAPTGSSNTQDLKIGQTVTVTEDGGDKWDVTVNSVTYRTTGCGTDDDGFSDPDKGDAYLLIDVTYQSTSGNASYNPFDWTAVDPDGNEYDPALFADCKPELDSGNALVGKRHGIVTIEVKAGVKHGQVIYSENLFDDQTSSWAF